MNLSNVTFFVVLSLSVSNVIGYAQTFPEPLKLEQAVALAVDADPWLTGSQFTQEALNDEAIAAATLPDPRMSLMAGNFPVDSFDINQEGMTQLSVGISQMFPRGDSLSLTRRQKQQLAEQHPLLRLDRRAKVGATVSQLWLEVFKAQESIRLIEQDRALFEQLVDAAKAGYSSALGRARQQDVIRAQLELTRLEDRLTMLRQQQQAAQKLLSEWIGAPATVPLAPVLPTQSLSRPLSVPTIEYANEHTRYEWIRHHPALRALDQRIDATQTGVDLAKQKYKPEWGLTAQYGYRDNDPMGRDRADLFSVGVNFDLPIFTGNRQDKEVSAAVNRTEAIKTEKHLLGRRLMAELETASVQLARLDERQALYADQLLPQMAEQAEASLTAYNNDDGDFAEAVRARIAELNAKVDALAIAVDRQKTIAQINYLLAEASFDDAREAKPF
ncbi:MAG: transporter [Alteromonadaceae bacterium]|uniref:TolC family protein n=1 Tax=Rheinheimera TaxID=67575 RepID=UPI000C45D7CD|nr:MULTISPECIES: TolC family protein [Rheinheimera]MBJ92799.1 transporter [Alteromonadaceae bacterium]MCD1599086.1 TolC family protein [Rheinheimera aquimaris]|tara:strand:+ start:1079 stop:2410 length:1332 start_codon:yes stop_codon:yes gene_type:complete